MRSITDRTPATVRRRWAKADLSLLAILIALSALAWSATVGLATPDMTSGVLAHRQVANMGGMSGMTDMGGTGAATLGMFVGTWTVMMVAMMLPAVAPVVVAFDRWTRRSRWGGLSTSSFVSGYLVVWSVTGLLAFAILRSLDLLDPSPGWFAARVGAFLLIVAGVWQLTPLKYACLRQCQSPLAFLTARATTLGERRSGPFVVGMSHGMYCLGCCWSLMLVLLLLGMMNLAWMAGVSAAIFAEKVLVSGRTLAVVLAGVLIVAGVALMFEPALIGA